MTRSTKIRPFIQKGEIKSSSGSITLTNPSPESEKPRQRVSNADRKVFANPESFCNKLIIG